MQPMPSDTQTAFPPLLRGVILGLIIGVVIGYVLPKSPSTPAPVQNTIATQQGAPTTQAPTSTTTPPPPPPAAPQGFYGIVQTNDKGVITAQELLPTNKPSSKVFTITTDAKTAYTYQKPSTDKKTPFTASVGKVQNIKKGMYLFVLTQDNPTTTTNVTAQTIMYSEKSPF